MRNPALEEYSYDYRDKTYYFCCSNCIEEFKEDPEKYISRIKEIKVEAYQFGYTPSTIKVKKGNLVKLTLSSRDTTHGFYIKEYGINVTIKKGATENVDFVAEKEGEFAIVCSVYCGRGHANMQGMLAVEK